MPPVLHQRCVLALLLAFWSACGTALMAWGVVEFPLHDALFQFLISRNSHAGVGLPPSVEWFSQPLVWAGLGLLGLSLWGQGVLASGHRRATDTSWPWHALLMALSCHASWWVLETLTVVEYSAWPKQLSQAAVGIFLFMGLMAERIDARWGELRTVLAGVAAIVLAALWVLWGGGRSEVFDARVLLLLQVLPLLLVPAGVLALPGRGLCRGECLFMCLVYAVTLAAIWVPASLPIAVISPVSAGSEAFWHALPWGALAAWCLLLLLPISRALQNHARRGSAAQAGAAKKGAQTALSRFALEALPIPNRRRSS